MKPHLLTPLVLLGTMSAWADPPAAESVPIHRIALSESGRFAGWPANNGLWSWDDGREILVGCTLGTFKEQAGHNIEEPYRSVLVRSRDAGETWTLEDPGNFVGDAGTPADAPGDIDFTSPGLAIRCVGSAYHGSDDKIGSFFVSVDRGRKWRGPFRFTGLANCPEQQGREQTPRTDYLPLAPRSCLFFLSSRPVGGTLTDDRAYVVRTDDGGATFRHLAWIVPPSDPYRAVMPSTVLVGRDDLVTAVRRRTKDDQRFWIDAWFSRDGGLNWSKRSEIGSTGAGNGNPPALVRMRDGRLCCVYGDRKSRRMVARFSTDKGLTWGAEAVLRDDFQTDRFNDADFGYPRLVERPDGTLLAVYYFATAANPQAHLATTIFQPPTVP